MWVCLFDAFVLSGVGSTNFALRPACSATAQHHRLCLSVGHFHHCLQLPRSLPTLRPSVPAHSCPRHGRALAEASLGWLVAAARLTPGSAGTKTPRVFHLHCKKSEEEMSSTSVQSPDKVICFAPMAGKDVGKESPGCH